MLAPLVVVLDLERWNPHIARILLLITIHRESRSEVRWIEVRWRDVLVSVKQLDRPLGTLHTYNVQSPQIALWDVLAGVETNRDLVAVAA